MFVIIVRRTTEITKALVSKVAVVAVAVAVASGCHGPHGGEVESNGTPANEIAAKGLAQRTRINSFFYVALVPKLKNCWGQISGKGEIGFKLTFHKSGQAWEWQKAELESTVPKAQADLALACMRDSARGSSFPIAPEEARAHEFQIHWFWPVPFPVDISELEKMSVINPGGGKEPPPAPKCVDCQRVIGSPRTAECVSTSSGWSICINDSDGMGCRLLEPCSTGWSGFWGGDLFIASTTPGLRDAERHELAQVR